MSLFVDADACPVKDECVRVAERLGVRVYIVCNGGIRPSAHPLVETVFVTDGPDEADKWIAGRAGQGDVVVTGDVPLAAKCVATGARVIKHNGEVLTARNIGNVLATRDLMADLRAADPFRQGGGRAFSKQDRSRFLDALDRVLRAAAGDRKDVAEGRDGDGGGAL
ncbi:MAG: YaiI/YqxD family protein [Paracoccaceae bacterium]